MPELDARWVIGKRWRVGRKLGRTIYAQIGAEPALEDVVLGVLDDARIAQAICDEHNAALDERQRVADLLGIALLPIPSDADNPHRAAGTPMVDAYRGRA